MMVPSESTHSSPLDLLVVKELTVRFRTGNTLTRAVNGLDLRVGDGEIVALVGESGSGKSATALSILRLLPPRTATASGAIWFRGRELLGLKASEMREIRGSEIGMIFQEPMTSLNPAMTIGRQIAESLQLHLGMSKRQARERTVDLLGMVGIANARRRLEEHPHQLSGGMRQRVMIAIALACEPALLIADEPTTALDVTIQAQVLEVMASLAQTFGTAVILITHNLGVVARYSHHVNVMYGGRIVESARAADLFQNPRHPYTRGLLRSIPSINRDRRHPLVPIEGSPPSLTELPVGCTFAPRCQYATEECHASAPSLDALDDSHSVACWHAAELWEENAHHHGRVSIPSVGAGSEPL